MKTKLFLMLLITLFLNATNAQVSGDLDTTFGTNGKVTTNFGQGDFTINSQIIQPDGKILLCGQIENYTISYGFIVRLNANGSLDTSFNTSGKTINETIEDFNKISLQSDGKIIVGGSKNRDVALARYDSNGTLDSTFDSDGMVFSTTEATNNRDFVDLDLQTDGKIVVLSQFYSGNNDYRVLRYTSNGSLDNAFGNNGSITTDLGNEEFPKSIVVQSDGKILVGGTTFNTTLINPFIARYNSTGILDNGFNSNGKRIYSITSSDFSVSNLVVQSDGKILFYCKSYISSLYKIQLVRVNSNSSLDTTFDSDGIAIATSPNTFNGKHDKLRIQADGKYTLFTTTQGLINNVSNNDILGMRFNTSGTLDTTFDTDGIITIAYFSLNDNFGDFNCVGNSIILSGNTQENLLLGKISVAKLTATASFDTTFDTDGKLFFTFPIGGADYANTSEIQSDGKILVGGTSYINYKEFFIITRYNTNGSIDTTFGTNGVVIIDNSSFVGTVNDIAIDTNGKIIVSCGFEAIVLRLNSNGTLDTTFGTNGFASFATSYSSAYDIKILSNGKILIAGYKDNTIGTTTSHDFMLARLNSSGTLDTTFGTNGISNLGSTIANYEILYKIEVQSDGKIVAAGTINNGSDLDIVIYRYNSNGTFDTTFNGNGSTTFASSGLDRPKGLAIQNDGKILVSGELNNTIKIARFTSSGAVDTSFDSDGIIDVSTNDMTYCNGMKLTSDQKIFLIGEIVTSDETSSEFSTLKFNSNGTLDTPFANSGKLTTNFNSVYNEGKSALITTDNKLILCGNTYSVNNNSTDFGLAKYHIESNLSSNTFNEKTTTFYPNPAKDILHVQDNVKSVKLFSLLGKEIEVFLENNSINISNFEEGIYLIQLTLTDDKIVNTKLIKK